MRLNPLLYKLSRRGVPYPITKEEREAFTAADRCVGTVPASAKHWEPGFPLLANHAG